MEKTATYRVKEQRDILTMLSQSQQAERNPKIEIKSVDGVFTEIYIDGHKLRGVRSWHLRHDGYGTAPTLTVDLNALDLSVDGKFLLKQKGYGEIDISFSD